MSTFDLGEGVRKTCSTTGSVRTADFPNPVLSVGTTRHPRTVCPRDSATCKHEQIFSNECRIIVETIIINRNSINLYSQR